MKVGRFCKGFDRATRQQDPRKECPRQLRSQYAIPVIKIQAFEVPGCTADDMVGVLRMKSQRFPDKYHGHGELSRAC